MARVRCSSTAPFKAEDHEPGVRVEHEGAKVIKSHSDFHGSFDKFKCADCGTEWTVYYDN